MCNLILIKLHWYNTHHQSFPSNLNSNMNTFRLSDKLCVSAHILLLLWVYLCIPKGSLLFGMEQSWKCPDLNCRGIPSEWQKTKWQTPNLIQTKDQLTFEGIYVVDIKSQFVPSSRNMTDCILPWRNASPSHVLLYVLIGCITKAYTVLRLSSSLSSSSVVAELAVV